MATTNLSEEARQRLFFTWTAQKKAAPLEIVGGEGARFQTADGAWWWDLGSTTWNANLGHSHPHMLECLQKAAARPFVAGPSAVFADKVRAGQMLAEIAPVGLSKSFICLSGAEANENAVKMARMVTGRRKIVARTRSYHGATLAMLSLSGDPRREKFEPGLPGVVRMTDPYCYRCSFDQTPDRCALECADDLTRALLEEGPDTVAAVIVEGVTGANGVFPPPPGYFARLRQICDRHGVLLICDEVLSGFGRTGRWWAIDHQGISPDIITCAKGLTAGYAPGGAVIVSQRIADFFEDEVLSCGLTTYAHPMVCSAICAAIEAYGQNDLFARVERLGQWLSTRLSGLPSWVGNVRGIGLLWALELVEKGRTPLPADKMDAVFARLKRNHIYTHRRDNFLYLAPPLVITQEQLEECLQVLLGCLEEELA